MPMLMPWLPPELGVVDVVEVVAVVDDVVEVVDDVVEVVDEVVDVVDVVDDELEVEVPSPLELVEETTGPVPTGLIECTLPTTLMLPFPETETTGVALGFVATDPGSVTVPLGVVTVPEDPEPEPEPEPDPLPTLVLALPPVTTVTGVAPTGVGAEVVGVGVVVVIVGFEPELPLPLPEVGLDEPEPRVGLPATGLEIDAGVECPRDRRDEPLSVATPPVEEVCVPKALPAAVSCARVRALTAAMEARPRDAEAEGRAPGFGCAVSVCVAGNVSPPSLGQPL
jgi:hypothetical protein